MEEYLKSRHTTINRELTLAKEAKLKAPTIGQEKVLAMRIVEKEACIEEINKAQRQLRHETAI